MTEDGCDVLVRLLAADTEQHVSCMEKRLHLPLEPADGARLELLSVQPEEPVVTVTADGFQIRVTVTVRTAGVRPPAGHRGDGAGARLPVCLCTVADDRALGRGRPVDACQALLLERAAHPRNERPHGRCRHG